MRIRLHVRRAAAAQDGFTLPELLVVLAIVGIILAGITQLLTSALKSQTEQTNRTQAQQGARLGLDKLRREIRCASALTTPSGYPSGYPASGITVTLGSYCPTVAGPAATVVTWCTKDKNGATPPVAGAQPYTLWRYTGPACSGTGTRWASNLVDTPTISGGKIFTASVDTGLTTLTGIPPTLPLTLPSATINVVSTLNFNTGANTIAFGPSGHISCTGTTATSFIGCTGGQAGQYPRGVPVYNASSTPPPRATLSVSLALDLTPANTNQRFVLIDNIVLRNSQPF